LSTAVGGRAQVLPAPGIPRAARQRGELYRIDTRGAPLSRVRYSAR
jgi:hypothetical protein